jgi:NADPH:quinone reductase
MAKSFSTRGVLLRSFDAKKPLSVGGVSLRTLRADEVLIQIAAASINPSDLVFLRNHYGISKPLPVVPGFEGSGIVMDAGISPKARRLLNRRVACRAPRNGHGTWARHMIAKASDCTILHKNISLEEGAALLVNPLTAWALISEAKRRGARAFVQTASAGGVGKMLLRLGKRLGLRSVCVVRKPTHKGALKKLGAREVLCSQDADFFSQLQASCRREKVTIAFDAVGGKLTGAIARALPPDGHVIVYGALAGRACQIHPASLIFEGKKLSGFWLTEKLKTLSPQDAKRMTDAVQRRMKDDLATTVQARFGLEQINEAIACYKANRSKGKVLLVQQKPHDH